MATQIKNQATLNYTSGTANLSTSSNTATVKLQGPLEVAKYSLENSYQIGKSITYNVFITNTGANPLTNINVVDDLGTYAFTETTNVTPLTYIGPAKVFINQVFSQDITGTVSDEDDTVTFVIPSLEPGRTLLLEYKATVNKYAGATIGTSIIENIVTVTADDNTVIATNTIPVGSYANLDIKKSMSPDPVVDGSTLTYTFVISNYGTIPATKVVLRDVFNPAPDINSTTVDGVAAEATYELGIFQYPRTSEPDIYSVPAATFTQDEVTGEVSITPGTSTVIVKGYI